jgi:hypothetical protein
MRDGFVKDAQLERRAAPSKSESVAVIEAHLHRGAFVAPAQDAPVAFQTRRGITDDRWNVNLEEVEEFADLSVV